MTDEKRRFSRVAFDVKAKLTVDQKEYSVESIDNLSVGGCLLGLDVELIVGSSCIFSIFLPQMAPAVEICGEVVRTGGGKVGLKFTAVEPDNLFHLQNIVRYNAQDPDAIEQEISARPGLK